MQYLTSHGYLWTSVVKLLVLLKGLLFITLLTLTPLSAQSGEIVTYILTDHLGSPVIEMNGAGQVIKREVYGPYGQAQISPNNSGIGYTGHMHDGDTGLTYMQARYFDPEAIRFLSTDPVRFSPGQPNHFNPYWYAEGNPYKYTDPDGRKVRFAENVSKQFKADFAKAIKYLNKHGISNNIAKLEKSDVIITIQEPSVENEMYYNPEAKTIVWDSHSALETTDGGKQTPALGLGHEAEHALGDIEGTMESTYPDPESPYDTAEEKRVIEGWETPAAKKAGEGTRSDHGGRAYQVECSTCVE